MKYSLASKTKEVCFRTLGTIKKIYKKNENLIIQYTASPSTNTVNTINISIKVEGDTNRDGIVDSKDLSNITAKYNKKSGESGYLAAWDFNNDGVIDIYDIAKVASKL